MMMWLNVSVAILNATLQLLVIYRLASTSHRISDLPNLNNQAQTSMCTIFWSYIMLYICTFAPFLLASLWATQLEGSCLFLCR